MLSLQPVVNVSQATSAIAFLLLVLWKLHKLSALTHGVHFFRDFSRNIFLY